MLFLLVTVSCFVATDLFPENARAWAVGFAVILGLLIPISRHIVKAVLARYEADALEINAALCRYHYSLTHKHGLSAALLERICNDIESGTRDLIVVTTNPIYLAADRILELQIGPVGAAVEELSLIARESERLRQVLQLFKGRIVFCLPDDRVELVRALRRSRQKNLGMSRSDLRRFARICEKELIQLKRRRQSLGLSLDIRRVPYYYDVRVLSIDESVIYTQSFPPLTPGVTARIGRLSSEDDAVRLKLVRACLSSLALHG